MRIKYLYLFILFCIFLISGCTESGLIPIIIKKEVPPPFSFLDNDPNDITLEYIARMERYDAIIKASPIPVFVINQGDLPEKYYTFGGVKKELFGLLIQGWRHQEYPEDFIFLRKNVPPEQIVTSYFHEIKHYECIMTKCQCSDSTTELGEDSMIISAILREKHAMLNELERSWEAKDSLLISHAIIVVAGYILSNEVDIMYKMAAISVTEEPLWKDSLDYISNLEKRNR